MRRFVLFLVLFPYFVFADTETLLFGGGGEGPISLFGLQLKDNFEKLQQQYLNSFGSVTKSYLHAQFTENELITQLEYIRNKKPPPAQVLIHVITHGSFKGGHGWAIAGEDITQSVDGDILTGTILKVSKIKNLLNQIAENGTKVAVIDGSCFSGGSINELSGKNICVISSTISNQTTMGVGVIAPFMKRFMESLDKIDKSMDLNGDNKVDLEELYLISRRSSLAINHHNAPMISSQPDISEDILSKPILFNKNIDRILEKLIPPEMRHNTCYKSDSYITEDKLMKTIKNICLATSAENLSEIYKKIKLDSNTLEQDVSDASKIGEKMTPLLKKFDELQNELLEQVKKFDKKVELPIENIEIGKYINFPTYYLENVVASYYDFLFECPYEKKKCPINFSGLDKKYEKKIAELMNEMRNNLKRRYKSKDAYEKVADEILLLAELIRNKRRIEKLKINIDEILKELKRAHEKIYLRYFVMYRYGCRLPTPREQACQDFVIPL